MRSGIEEARHPPLRAAGPIIQQLTEDHAAKSASAHDVDVMHRARRQSGGPCNASDHPEGRKARASMGRNRDFLESGAPTSPAATSPHETISSVTLRTALCFSRHRKIRQGARFHHMRQGCPKTACVPDAIPIASGEKDCRCRCTSNRSVPTPTVHRRRVSDHRRMPRCSHPE